MLGMNAVAAINGGRLVFFDANEMVSRLTARGQPEWSRFDALIGATVRDLIANHGGLRAYGEMVGILWSRGQCAASVAHRGVLEPVDAIGTYVVILRVSDRRVQ